MKTQKTILLIEDDPGMRDLVLLAFTRRFSTEYEILSAKNGLEALDVIRKKIPDLMILDILLPQMNGLQLIQKLQEEHFLRQLKIIIISGLGFREIVQQTLEAGVNDFLVKPFKIEKLIERAETCLISQL